MANVLWVKQLDGNLYEVCVETENNDHDYISFFAKDELHAYELIQKYYPVMPSEIEPARKLTMLERGRNETPED